MPMNDGTANKFHVIRTVINGEKAAFNTPIFSQKRERTLDMLIRDMYAEVMTEHRGVGDDCCVCCMPS